VAAVPANQRRLNFHIKMWNHFVVSGEDCLEGFKTSKPYGDVPMSDDLTKLSDSELLRLSLAGDQSAFVALYERLKGPIFRYAFYMTNSKAAAEEITQEVFFTLIKVGSRYKKARGDVAAFAFGIARNLVKRVRRREQAYEQLPEQDALDRLSGNSTLPETLTGEFVKSERLQRVRSAIVSLPDHYRQVIVVCDLCELSYEEAAARLGCAVGTVRSRLSRARSLLAEKLKSPKNSRRPLPAAGTEECLI